MTQAFNQARTLEQAGKQSASYDTNIVAAVSEDKSEVSFTLAAAPKKVFSNRNKDGKENYFFCGNVRHPRSNCPARNFECGKCKKMGHWARCCKSTLDSERNLSAAIHNKLPNLP